MKKLLLAAIAILALAPAQAEKLTLVHTNDTHSQIDPTDKDAGGIKRRKVVIDSIRNANPNVMLIDAGDAVQGTLFFTIYGGEVETKMMNLLGYDIAILGNHDFDNGVEALAKNLRNSDVEWLATNYDLTQSEIAPYFKPYDIRTFGDKKVGFIALNLNPKGMISDGNYDGVVYLDAIKAANAMAWYLKNIEHVDAVVAISHLGYEDVPSPSDQDVARASENIDVILGGHSHTTIKPGSGREWIENAVGRPVLVTQNGKSGLVVAEVTIDLDSIGTKLPTYNQIAIDSRLDNRVDNSIDSILAPYRKGVDEMMGKKIGRSARELPTSEPGLQNFVADFIADEAKSLVADGHIDMAIGNKGSLRRSLPGGDITQGAIIMMQPFNNRIVVLDIKGSDLIDAFNVMASRGGDAVSAHADATMANGECISVKVNGQEVNPGTTYRVATIDYLANGGDYMEPLTRARRVATSKDVVYNDLIKYIQKNYSKKKINPSNAPRMHH